MQNTIYNVEVATLELCHKFWNKLWPLAGKVFMTNVANSITQLSEQHRQTKQVLHCDTSKTSKWTVICPGSLKMPIYAHFSLWAILAHKVGQVFGVR